MWDMDISTWLIVKHARSFLLGILASESWTQSVTLCTRKGKAAGWLGMIDLSPALLPEKYQCSNSIHMSKQKPRRIVEVKEGLSHRKVVASWLGERISTNACIHTYIHANMHTHETPVTGSYHSYYHQYTSVDKYIRQRKDSW